MLADVARVSLQELLRQKLGLPEVDSSEYWMAERSENEYLDVAFSPAAVLTELVGSNWKTADVLCL